MGSTYRLLWDLAKDPKMTNAHYRVYALIHAHCMGKDTCWPSINTICGLARLKRSRVFVILKDLEGWEYIRREPRKGRSSIFYILDHINKKKSDINPADEPVQSEDPGPLSGPVQSGDPGPLSGPAHPKPHSQNKEPQPPADEPVQLETPGKNEEKVDPSSQGTRVLSVDQPGAPEWTQKKSTRTNKKKKSTVRTSSSSTLNLKAVLVEKGGSGGKTNKEEKSAKSKQPKTKKTAPKATEPWILTKQSRTESEVEAAIDSLQQILPEYQRKYKALDMSKVFREFKDYWLYGANENGKPNWKRRTHWRRTLTTWCDKQIEWTNKSKQLTSEEYAEAAKPRGRVF